MNAPDLQRGLPPRWSDAVEGIVWLPRLAAKVRAHDAGTLGTYLLGQSPIDDELLKTAQLNYAQLIEIVRASADDAAVLAAILKDQPPPMSQRQTPQSSSMPPRALERLVRRCLEKKPEDRWHSAHDLKPMLELIDLTGPTSASVSVSSSGIQAAPPNKKNRLWPAIRRRGGDCRGGGSLAMGSVAKSSPDASRPLRSRTRREDGIH